MNGQLKLAPDAPEIVRGRVKWFDGARGFGFVACDDYESDILLHANTLRDFGQSSVASEVAITIRVRRGDRGLQASAVLAIEGPGPEAVEDAPTPCCHPHPCMPSLPARVKWFSREKGYGFANVFDRDGDVFIHVDVLRRSGLSDLQAGEAIRLRAAKGPDGMVALEVARWDALDRCAA